MVSFIINNKFDGVQCKILLYMAFSKEHEMTVKNLSEKTNETQRDIIESLKKFKSDECSVNITENEIFEIEFIKRATIFKIRNDTRYKIYKKEDKLNEQAKEIGELWKKVCQKPRSDIKDKRLKILKNAIEKYGYEKVEKSILGCSRTLWNMGYNDLGEKLNQRYVDLSLILRNEEYVERFIENSELPEIDEQIQEVSKKKKSLKNNKVDDAKETRNEWLSKRLGMFDSENDVKKISSK